MSKPTIWLGLSLCALAIGVLYYSSRPHSDNHSDENHSDEEKEEGLALTGAEKQLSTWWWARAYPDPSNITGKYAAAWEQAQELKQNTNKLLKQRFVTGIRGRSEVPVTSDVQGTAGYGSWLSFGPKVFGGRILSLAISNNLNSGGFRTIFAGSASGGIWKSTTGGVGATAWQPVTTGTHVLGVASIVYHPADDNILLAGTGEVYRVETLTSGTNSTSQVGNIGRNVWKARGTYGIGILKTTDGGQTWRNVMPKISSDLFAIQKIRYDPTNSSIVYACATDGLYKSTDGGETWIRTWAGIYVSDVVINPANNQMLVIGVGNYANATKGIYKSINGGTTFTKMTVTGLPAAYRGYIKLAYATGTTIFASIGTDDQNGTPNDFTAVSEYELFRSADFGTTWAAITNSNHSQFQAGFSHCLTPYPGSAVKVFIAGVDKYVITTSTATNNAGTRTVIGGSAATMSTYLTPGANEGTNYIHADVHDIQFVPGSAAEAYFATDGGVFRTTNANVATISSMTFSTCNGGLQVHQFYGPLAHSQTNANLIIGGLQDNNVIRYNGTGWARIIGGDGGPAMFKPDDETIVIASRDARTIYRSTNSGGAFGGAILQNLGLNFTPAADERTGFMAPIAVSRANPAKMYVASDNLHVSVNSGTSFTATDGTTNNNAPASMTRPIEATYKTAVAMGVSNTNANKLYISTSPFAQQNNDALRYNPPANIRKSTDGGVTFTTITGTLPDRLVTDFAISETSDENVFVTLGGFGTTHVYETTNGGATWTPRGSGLPDVPFNTILIDPNNANIIYAGSDFGVYVSPDKGVNWYDFNNGFWDATYVMDLAIAPGATAGSKILRAATHGKGIFQSHLFDITTLPVTVTSFSGKSEGSSNLLQWTVRDEYNLSRYVLERSTKSGRFEAIATIAAKNTDGERTYAFTDANILPSYFYRLKSVNTDGSYTYSDVISLSRKNPEGVRVVGNPFYNDIQVQIAVAGSGKVWLSLYDMKGALVRREQVLVNGAPVAYTLRDLSRYPSGMYQLEAVFNRQRWTQRLMKR